MPLKVASLVWWVLAGCFVIIIIAGGVTIGLKSGQERSVEIMQRSFSVPQGEVYVGGEVSNPGVYPYYAGDTIEELIRAAGGVTDNADLSRLELRIPRRGGLEEPQKVNINTAEAWLLAALPGIGEKRAQAIIDFRREHGRFRDVNELLEIEGFGTGTLEKIRHLITVGD